MRYVRHRYSHSGRCSVTQTRALHKLTNKDVFVSVYLSLIAFDAMLAFYQIRITYCACDFDIFFVCVCVLAVWRSPSVAERIRMYRYL